MTFSYQICQCSIAAIKFPGYLHMALKAKSRFPFFELLELSIFWNAFLLAGPKNVTELLQRSNNTINANLIYHPDATSLALVRIGQNRWWCFGISVEMINLYTKQDHHSGPQLCLSLVEYFLMTTQNLKSTHKSSITTKFMSIWLKTVQEKFSTNVAKPWMDPNTRVVCGSLVTRNL